MIEVFERKPLYLKSVVERAAFEIKTVKTIRDIARMNRTPIEQVYRPVYEKGLDCEGRIARNLGIDKNKVEALKLTSMADESKDLESTSQEEPKKPSTLDAMKGRLGDYMKRSTGVAPIAPLTNRESKTPLRDTQEMNVVKPTEAQKPPTKRPQ